jgi:hypothetical protein
MRCATCLGAFFSLMRGAVNHSGYSNLGGACRDGVAIAKPSHPQLLVTLRSCPVSR